MRRQMGTKPEEILLKTSRAGWLGRPILGTRNREQPGGFQPENRRQGSEPASM